MSTPRVIADAAGIARAVAVLRGGGVIAYPTETLYGLGVDALSASALERLLEIKGRAPERAISVLVSGLEMARQLVARMPPSAQELIRRHWPGPLTLVLPARPGLPPALVGPGGGIGLRVSSDPVALALVEALARPLTATSANHAGEPAATVATAIAVEGLDLILDGGERQAPPSTVVEVIDSPVVLRQGAIRIERP